MPARAVSSVGCVRRVTVVVVMGIVVHEQEVAAGRVLPLDAVPTATALTWMTERYLQLLVARTPGVPVERVTETLTTILTRVLYGVPQASSD